MSRWVNRPHKKWSPKSPPNLYAPLSRVNMTTMIRQETVSPFCQFLKANLLTGLFTTPWLTLDHWLPLGPKVTRSLGTCWGLNQDPSDCQCSTLTNFSESLVHKWANLKEPYNLDMKEQVTTKNILKKKTGFTWNPQPQRQCAEGVFQIHSHISCAYFSNNISIPKVRVNNRETELYSTFETS